jgi:crossover junction endonuclease MUS81
MDVNYSIDIRETKLKELLKDKGFESKPLDIGDVQIVIGNDERQKTILFERKTISDLESSIKDGRWREQKTRCLASGFHIFYIIENWNANLMKTNQMVTSAVINVLLNGPIKVIFTNNVADTALFLMSIQDRINKNPQKYFEEQNELCYENCMSIKQKKKDNITKRHILLQQICAFPGISMKKATVIVDHLGLESFGQLYEYLKDNPKRLLECKGIGKELSKQILENMFTKQNV